MDANDVMKTRGSVCNNARLREDELADIGEDIGRFNNGAIKSVVDRRLQVIGKRGKGLFQRNTSN